jgi:hypothetical protein
VFPIVFVDWSGERILSANWMSFYGVKSTNYPLHLISQKQHDCSNIRVSDRFTSVIHTYHSNNKNEPKNSIRQTLLID